MPRTSCFRRLKKQQAIWADSLVAVMLNGDGLAPKETKHKRGKNRTCQLDDVRLANQLPQSSQIGLTDNLKGQRRIVKTVFRRRRRHRHKNTLGCQPLRQQHHISLSATDFRGKRMGIDEHFHNRFGRRAEGGDAIATSDGITLQPEVACEPDEFPRFQRISDVK